MLLTKVRTFDRPNSITMRKFLPLTVILLLLGAGKAIGQTTTFIIPDSTTCESSISIPIVVENFNNVTAFSYTVEWDENILQLNSVSGFALQHLDITDFGLTQTASGFYTLAWVDNDGSGEMLTNGTVIYNMNFTVLGNIGDMSSVGFITMPTNIVVGIGFPPVSGTPVTTDGSVTLDDIINPTINCPLPVSVTTPDPSVVVNGIAPASSGDNCDPNPTITYSSTGVPMISGNNDASGRTFNAGATIVTYTIVDNEGNSSSCDFTVTVNQVASELDLEVSSDTRILS